MRPSWTGWSYAWCMQPRTGVVERIIYVDRDGNPLPDKRGAVGGEVITTKPDGTEEHTLFTLGAPTRRP